MLERKNESPINIVFGEKFNPFDVLVNRVIERQFILDKIGVGSVELDYIGTEGGNFGPIGRFPGEKLNLITIENGKSILKEIPRHMIQLSVVVRWDENKTPVTRNFRCVVSVGDIELTANNSEPDDSQENWAIFNWWESQELRLDSDFLLIHMTPDLLKSMKIRFEK